MDVKQTQQEAASLVQVPSRHRLLGFLAQRLKQRDRELNGSLATHLNVEATQAEEKEAAAPSWSADSECSDTDLATKEGEAEDTTMQQTETPINPSDASSTLEKRSGSALGGWLTRLTGAYSVAVRGLGGSLLVRGDRMNDFAETRDRLDRTAAELHGPGRVAGLRRWVNVMQALSMPKLQPLYTSSVPSNEGDWQTLTQVDTPGQTGPGMQLALQANDMWFVDPSDGEPLTFREVFMKSQALENIVAGFARWPISHPQEGEVLLELFAVTLGGSKELHASLVDCVLSLTAAAAKWQDVGASAEECLKLAQPLTKALGKIKQTATVAILDRKMAVLRGDISEQAAMAAQRHKFNQGSLQPTGDTSPGRLASGLAATAHVMAQAERLSQLAAEHEQLVIARVPPCDMSGTMLGMQDRHAALADAVVDAQARINDVVRQREDSQANRLRKVEGMEGRLKVVGDTISGLDASRDALLAQLAQVEALLAQAHAECADLEESRSVFEEGVAFSLDALQHQVDELAASQRRHTAESAMLQEGTALLALLTSQAPQVAVEQAIAARACAEEATQEFVFSACRHLYFQRAELQLLLRRLLFCAAELSSLTTKEESATRMGMSAITSDMAKQRRALLSSFVEAEASASMRLAEVDAVRSAVETTCNTRLPSPPHDAAKAAMSSTQEGKATGSQNGAQSLEEFVDLLQSIMELGRQINGLQRPADLPPPGQSLPLEIELESEMDAPPSSEADVPAEDQAELPTRSHRHCGPQKSLTSFLAHDDISSSMSSRGEQAHDAAEVPEVKALGHEDEHSERREALSESSASWKAPERKSDTDNKTRGCLGLKDPSTPPLLDSSGQHMEGKDNVLAAQLHPPNVL